jgi:sulfite reductase beta subunit-like hemoprotein
MYIYDDFDRTLVDERVREFRDQVERRLSGELTEEEFKPLRLMNGVYLQARRRPDSTVKDVGAYTPRGCEHVSRES